MQDLTKILKVGDRVWSIIFGEGVVARIDDDHIPIGVRFEGNDANYYFDKYGQYENGGIPQLYPIDQRPEIPAPIWPEVFEIQGDSYKKGEWVAVTNVGSIWTISKFEGIENGLPITLSESNTIDAWDEIRKLSSFNK